MDSVHLKPSLQVIHNLNPFISCLKKKDSSLQKYEAFYREVKARSAEKARQRQQAQEQQQKKQQQQLQQKRSNHL